MPEGNAEVKRKLVVPVSLDGKIVAVMGVGHKHRGSLSVVSLPEKGTTFTFLLPITNMLNA